MTQEKPLQSNSKRRRKIPRITETVEVEAVVIGRAGTPVFPKDVFKLAQMGCRDAEIARWFGITSSALSENFSDELITGRESLKQSLRQAQIRLALGGNCAMLIFLGKAYLGQREDGSSADDMQPLPFTDTDI